jgi:hypothetical protein
MFILGDRSTIVIKYKEKTVVGLVEPVRLTGPGGKSKEVLARIDSGATKSSIDFRLAADLALGPILKAKVVKSASGKGIRPIVEATVVLVDKEFKTEITLADRADMKYSVLIGQNILKKGYLIDPAKEIPKGK